MKFQFNPDLTYQREAINAIVDIFEGQEVCRTNFPVAPLQFGDGFLQAFDDQGAGRLQGDILVLHPALFTLFGADPGEALPGFQDLHRHVAPERPHQGVILSRPLAKGQDEHVGNISPAGGRTGGRQEHHGEPRHQGQPVSSQDRPSFRLTEGLPRLGCP